MKILIKLDKHFFINDFHWELNPGRIIGIYIKKEVTTKKLASQQISSNFG